MANETVRPMTTGQFRDIAATMIGAIPDDLSFDDAQQGVIGEKGTFVAAIRQIFEQRRVLGLDPSVFRVKLGGPETTDEIVSDLGFPANSYITQANFPLKPHTIEDVEIEIIDPGCSFSEGEGLKFLADAKLGRPTYEHALRFAEQCCKATTSERKPFVIFLHEAWQDPSRRRRVLFLNRRARYRELSLDYPGSRFRDRCALAGVRPRK